MLNSSWYQVALIMIGKLPFGNYVEYEIHISNILSKNILNSAMVSDCSAIHEH